MKVEKSILGILLIAVGLILSIVGMVGYTELADWNIPSAVMYAGYVLAILGIAFVYLDLKENEDLVNEYYDKKDTRDAMESAGDDDYLIDLCGQENEVESYSLFGTEKDENEATIIDMTQR